ncbi:hypothetical protein D3C81_1999280 [compost metagenome]
MIATIEDPVFVLIAILRVTDQASRQQTECRATSRPTTTFNCAQACARQAADKAADRPGTLIEGGSAVAVGGATCQQAAEQ